MLLLSLPAFSALQDKVMTDSSMASTSFHASTYLLGLLGSVTDITIHRLTLLSSIVCHWQNRLQLIGTALQINSHVKPIHLLIIKCLKTELYIGLISCYILSCDID